MSNEDFKWSHDEARTIGPALRDHSGVLTLELGNEITKINAWKLESMGLTRLGQELYIPTYLSFDKDKGILFGTDAKAAQTQYPDHTVHGFINLIGLERTDVQAIVTMQNRLYNTKKRDGPYFKTVTDNTALYKSLPRKDRRVRKWIRRLQKPEESDSDSWNISLSIPSLSLITTDEDDPECVPRIRDPENCSDPKDENKASQKFALNTFASQIKLWNEKMRKKYSKRRHRRPDHRVKKHNRQASNGRVEAELRLEETDDLMKTPSEISVDDEEAARQKGIATLLFAGTSRSFARWDYQAKDGKVKNFSGEVEGDMIELKARSNEKFGPANPTLRRTKGDTAGVAAGKPTPEAENQDPGFPVRIGKYDGEIEGTAANLGQERGRLVHQIADLERHGAKIFDQDHELDQHARIASMRAFDPLLIDCGPGGDDMEVKTLVKIFVEEIVNSLLDSFEDAGSIASDFLGPPAMKAIVISPAHFTDYQKELLQEAVYEGGLAIYSMSRKPLLCEPELRGLIGSFADRPTAETLLIDVGMQNFQLSHLDEMGYYKARCGQAGLGVERMLIALENAMLVAEWPRIQGHAQRSAKDRMADRTEAARVFKALTVPPLARKDGKANFNIKWESCTKQCPVTLDVLKDACEMVLMMMKDFIHKFLRDNGIDPAKKPFNIELIGGYSDSTILHDMCREALPASQIVASGRMTRGCTPIGPFGNLESQMTSSLENSMEQPTPTGSDHDAKSGTSPLQMIT